MTGSEDDQDSFSKFRIKWNGEKQGFRTWYGFIQNRAIVRQGLVERIVLEGLTLDKYLLEDEDGGKQYRRANALVYQMVGEPLMEFQKSTAYSLLYGHAVGDGYSVLQGFLVYFDGRTEEEIEDLEDQWRNVSFQTAGVGNLATYLAVHMDYVRRLNNSGAQISRIKAFRRMLKQLPDQYSMCRQGLSPLVDTWAKKEALAPTDPAVIREVNAAIGQFTKRLMRFNYDEKIEGQFQVKGLLALSLVPGESVNYVGNGKDESRDQCHNRKKIGHWARNCPDKKTGKQRGGGNSGGGKNNGKQLSASERAERLKNIRCWVCKQKGHYTRGSVLL